MRVRSGALVGIALGSLVLSGCLPDPLHPDNPSQVGGPTAASPKEPPNQAEIARKVRQIIVEHLGVEESRVTPGARFVEDLGADSLDLVELTMASEEVFDLEIPDKDCEKLKTVKDLTDYITKQLTPAPGQLDHKPALYRLLQVQMR